MYIRIPIILLVLLFANNSALIKRVMHEYDADEAVDSVLSQRGLRGDANPHDAVRINSFLRNALAAPPAETTKMFKLRVSEVP